MLPATLSTGRSLVMGILNVTPDSFSNGGLYVDTDVAVERTYRMVRQGTGIVNVGGESTRPGATALSVREEWDRIGAVVAALGKADIVVSVDMYHADTAHRAIDAGAEIVNDVIGGAGNPNMFSAVASNSCLYILWHGRGNARTMDSLASYGDIGAEVADELAASVARAVSSGVDASQIVVDPDFGFAKVGNDDWDLAANTASIMELGIPVLIGVSRKRFLTEIHNDHSGPAQRDDAAAALTAYFAEFGVWGVRVHEVAASRATVETVARLRTAGAYPWPTQFASRE